MQIKKENMTLFQTVSVCHSQTTFVLHIDMPQLKIRN